MSVIFDAMQRKILFEKVAIWMKSRHWKQKLAKNRGTKQSLFEHSLMEFDVLLELLPILAKPNHYNLNEVEQKILMVSVLVHDAGKETGSWQEYIKDPKPQSWVSHILPELTGMVVSDLCTVLGFDEISTPVQRIMAHCANFHHSRPGRSDSAILEAMLTDGSDRFLTLAHLVRGIDYFCSATEAYEAIETIKCDPALGNHLLITSHEVRVRGVSTTFLHRSAQSAFMQRGWKPLLFFSESTIYGADPGDYPSTPTVEEISNYLTAELDVALARDLKSLMVGSPTGNILPKPELFSFDEARQYLRMAAGKVSPQSFAKKNSKAKRKVIEDYWRLKGETCKPNDLEVELEAGRISVAQPEILVFKFFKAMMDPDKVEAVGKEGNTLAARFYEEVFGAGSWAALQSTSTLMPAKDMVKTVDSFWSLPGYAVNHPEAHTVGELPDNGRLEVLIEILAGIAEKVYQSIPRQSPRQELSRSMANAFANDLLYPVCIGDVRLLAQGQLLHYSRSKPFAGKGINKGIYLCPICNAAFDLEKGKQASADFVDNPQSHTNRAVSHGSFGYVMICLACYYERLLMQIMMGGRPAEVITFFPRLNLGPGKGEHLVRKVREWVEVAQAQMRGDTGSLEVGFSLGLTSQTARTLKDRNPSNLEPEELISLFSYRFAVETNKQRRREAMRRLKDEFDEDLESLSLACGQTYNSWEDAVTALIENRISQQECIAIRREVFRLYETIDIICETPNLIFIPLTYEIAVGNDESATSKALRRLYVSLILSLVFDVSVVIGKEGEVFEFNGYGGAAYVSPVPSVRSLIGSEWVSVDEAEKWVRAIGAASMLVQDTGFSPRSALYQILSAEPAEQIIRRIEENGGKSLTPHHLHLIGQLPGFGSLKEEMQS